MKQFEFESQLGQNATIKIPTECATQIPTGQPVHVILLLPETDDERVWRDFAAEQFVQGYAESDAIYDQLSEG